MRTLGHLADDILDRAFGFVVGQGFRLASVFARTCLGIRSSDDPEVWS